MNFTKSSPIVANSVDQSTSHFTCQILMAPCQQIQETESTIPMSLFFHRRDFGQRVHEEHYQKLMVEVTFKTADCRHFWKVLLVWRVCYLARFTVILISILLPPLIQARLVKFALTLAFLRFIFHSLRTPFSMSLVIIFEVNFQGWLCHKIRRIANRFLPRCQRAHLRRQVNFSSAILPLFLQS